VLHTSWSQAISLLDRPFQVQATFRLRRLSGTIGLSMYFDGENAVPALTNRAGKFLEDRGVEIRKEIYTGHYCFCGKK
jgi:hypothetical protein